MNHLVKTELREDPKSSRANGALSDCLVAVEMESVQPRAEEGIRLVIEIAKRGAPEVEIVNPLDFLLAGIMLFDETGRRVELPRVAPRLLINTGGAGRDRLNLPFRLDFVETDGRRLSDDEASGHAFRLAPDSRLRIGVAIDRVLPAEAKDANAVVPIPPGKYLLEVSVTLANDTDDDSRTLESPSPLEVILGQPAG